uniref:DB domain-containing protein n=1 Tax=Gongylonema pulchrum TaxID=637853 RepID=A0A183EJ66_9BILA
LECCRRRDLPDPCLNKCSYANYNQNAVCFRPCIIYFYLMFLFVVLIVWFQLRSMFLQIDPCPLLAANDIHFCAARGRDHRQCCTMNGVATTLARQKCLIFCDQRPQNETRLDLSYLPCFERFESIKGCFWRWARKQYQLDKLFITKWMEPKTNLQHAFGFDIEQQPPSPFDHQL